MRGSTLRDVRGNDYACQTAESNPTFTYFSLLSKTHDLGGRRCSANGIFFRLAVDPAFFVLFHCWGLIQRPNGFQPLFQHLHILWHFQRLQTHISTPFSRISYQLACTLHRPITFHVRRGGGGVKIRPLHLFFWRTGGRIEIPGGGVVLTPPTPPTNPTLT